jgi:hypothetical protein
MAMGIDQLFNSSGEIGRWLTASTTNVTGSLILTVFVMIMFLVLGMMLFKMPELLMALIIVPLMIVFITVGEIAVPMRIILGVLILVIGLGLYSFYPSK